MSAWATRVALLATVGGSLAILVLYAPTLDAPFLVPKFAALEVSASLGVVSFALSHAAPAPPRWSRGVALGAILVIATSLASWVAAMKAADGAPYATDALARWGSLFGLACGSSVLANVRDARRGLLEAVTVAAGTIAGVGLLQHVGALPFSIPVFSLPGSTFGNRNLAAEVIAMTLPLGVVASTSTPWPGTRVVLRVALALELLFLAVTRARGAWLGAAAGLVTVLWLLKIRGSRTTRVSIAVAVVATGIAAAVPGRLNAHDAGDTKRYSGVVTLLEGSLDTRTTALRTRLGLWRRTVMMTVDHPWLGVGPGNWPVLFPRYAEPDAARDGVLTATLAPRQAHDDALERAGETGVLGLLALLFLAGTVGLAARRHIEGVDEDRRAATVGATGALTALALVSTTGFPLEMPGTIALTGIALGLVVTEPIGAMSRPRPQLAYVAAALGFVSLVAAAFRAERSIRGSRSLAIAEHALHRDHGIACADEALDALHRSLAATPTAFEPELRTAQMLLRKREAEGAIGAARRALTLEPYSPNAHAILAAAYLAAGSPTAAHAAANDALTLLHDYPFALDVRARAEVEEQEPGAAAQDRARIADLASHAEDNDTRRTARTLLDQHD